MQSKKYLNYKLFTYQFLNMLHRDILKIIYESLRPDIHTTSSNVMVVTMIARQNIERDSHKQIPPERLV